MSDSDALRGRDVGGVCPHTGSAAFPAQRQVRITCLWREKRNQEGSCQAPTAGYCRGRVPAVAAGRLACPALVSSPLQDKRTASQRWQSLGRARQISLRQHRGSRHAARSARVARAAHAGRGTIHLAGNPALIAIVPPPATPAAAAGRCQDHNDRQNHQPLHALAPENGRAGREGAHSGGLAVGRTTSKFRLHGPCQSLMPTGCSGSVSRGHATIHHGL